MINYNVDSDGIATITWDMPNRAMNVLNEASMTAYAGALETALKDDKVKGIIITSGKDSFIAGADLEMILSLDTSDASKLMEQFSQLQRMFRRQETGGKTSDPGVEKGHRAGGVQHQRSGTPASLQEVHVADLHGFTRILERFRRCPAFPKLNT